MGAGVFEILTEISMRGSIFSFKGHGAFLRGAKGNDFSLESLLSERRLGFGEFRDRAIHFRAFFQHTLHHNPADKDSNEPQLLGYLSIFRDALRLRSVDCYSVSFCSVSSQQKIVTCQLRSRRSETAV